MIYYRWFPGDYMRDTMGLTWPQDLAYRRLLDSYYSTGTLPADRVELHQIARATNDEERAAVDKVVEKFFHADGSRLLQNRVEREFAERGNFIASQSKKGIKSGEVRRKKSADIPDQESNRGSTGDQPGLNRGSIPVPSRFEPGTNLPSPSPDPSALPKKKKAVGSSTVVLPSPRLMSPSGGTGASKGDSGNGKDEGAGKGNGKRPPLERGLLEATPLDRRPEVESLLDSFHAGEMVPLDLQARLLAANTKPDHVDNFMRKVEAGEAGA